MSVNTTPLQHEGCYRGIDLLPRETVPVNQTASAAKPLDRHRFNNPHAAIRAAGAEAARKGLRVFHCPYRHPAMQSSWLKGFAQEQQLGLDFL
ncbi:CrpP family protein [Pseudomonas gingeri]|nr:CrpP family protein [Pseudomonas gingeri]